MRSQQQLSRFNALVAVFVVATLCGLASNVAAQEQEQSSFLANIAKSVAFDPTTYAPAAIEYNATILDWNSSQTFFQHGFFEHNSRFTASGLPNDVAVGYDQGKHRILMDSLGTLETSALNSLVSRVIERKLMERYPEQRKRIRTIGWIERVAFASYMSYFLSAEHYQQWRTNEQLARQMGY